MRHVTISCLLVLVLSFPLAAGAGGAPFLGKWDAVAAVRGGKRMAVPPGFKMRYDFRKGGKLVVTSTVRGKARAIKGSWKVKGKILTLALQGRKQLFRFSVKGKVLTLQLASRSEKLLLQRPGSNAVKISAADRKRAAAAMKRYQLKVKTVEATESLAKLKVGAKSYFASDRYDQRGKLLPKRFPPGKTSWVPRVPCCAQRGRRCRPKAKTWRGPWRKLFFQLSDPHFFQYRYSAKGTGAKARVVLEARADLDCDGKYSHYKITGKVGPKGQPVFSRIVKRNPLE